MLIPLNRREMLNRMGSGLGMVGLAGVLADEGLLQAAPAASNTLAVRSPHFTPKAKHLIHLFMNGGPSQVDTFDPKPALEKYHGQLPAAAHLKTERKIGTLYKSPFKFHKCGQSGLEISELFPQLAGCADDLCVIRSMHTDVANHEPAFLMMTSGNIQPIRPSFGSWLCYGLGSENQNLPGFVVLCPGVPSVGPQLWASSFLPGIYQGCHIQGTDPKSVIEHLHNQQIARHTQRQQLDLLNALNRAHLDARDGDEQLDARIQSLEVAFRMQTEAQEAFDISQEPAELREAYGTTPFGQACLVARRLVERGVRTVQIFYGAGQPWDHHNNAANGHQRLARVCDPASATLLRDLKSRGLLDETLVLWGGEFGRTPTSEGAGGRDHDHYGFSVWLAGGGVKGGLAYGATDEFGFAAVENRVHIHDLHATLLHLMGLDHEKLTYRYSGRDFRLTDVHGHVIQNILA